MPRMSTVALALLALVLGVFGALWIAAVAQALWHGVTDWRNAHRRQRRGGYLPR